MAVRTRFLLTAAAVAALSGGGVVSAAGARSEHQRSPRQFVLPEVFVGYADGFRKGEPDTPSPWKGSAGVIFKGCNYLHPDRCPKNRHGNDKYDSGAIRIVNNSQENITVTKATVMIGDCTFHPWPKLDVTVKPTRQLILTQTGGKAPCGTTGGRYNFDSSDTNHTCTADGLIPVVNLTFNDETLAYFDTSRVLNTGGVDVGNRACPPHNETEPWSQVYGGG